MYEIGKIILTPFPFTDLSNTKVRPALIVGHDLSTADVTVAYISSQKRKLGSYDVHFLASKTNGLKTDSTIMLSKLATLEKKVILGELGKLELPLLELVKKKMKKYFKLS